MGTTGPPLCVSESELQREGEYRAKKILAGVVGRANQGRYGGGCAPREKKRFGGWKSSLAGSRSDIGRPAGEKKRGPNLTP